jgi:Ethanolamine utilization protein EutJ (predicted chaperonin)
MVNINAHQERMQMRTIIDIIRQAQCADVIRTSFDYEMAIAIKRSIIEEIRQQYPMQTMGLDTSIPPITFGSSSKF